MAGELSEAVQRDVAACGGKGAHERLTTAFVSTRGAEVSAMMTGEIRSWIDAQPDSPHLLWLNPEATISADRAFFVAGDTWDTFSKLFMHGEKTFLHVG